jgi:hypothetical protein
MRSFLFYLLFKIATFITGFSNSLKAARLTTGGDQRRLSQSTLHPSPDNFSNDVGSLPVADDQIKIARVVFAAIWEHQNLVHMESWGKVLQELGRSVFHKGGTDFSCQCSPTC